MQWTAGLLAAVLFAVQAQAQSTSSMTAVVDRATRYLVSNWLADEGVNEYMPPQVLPIAAGSRVYGGCEELVSGFEVGGSSYCGATHTIYLVPEELTEFKRAFGSSSIAYVVAHEFGHAFQEAFEVKLEGPARELQADCFAGMLISSGNEQLGITRDDVIAMATTAYNVGSDTHGSGEQRAFALYTGMGVLFGDCKAETMQSLANGRFDNDPRMLNMLQERSQGGNRINTSETPYPKSTKILFGI